MRARPIGKEDYPLLLKLDKKVYPTDSPVTKDMLSRWYAKYPEFGLVYEENGEIAGLCAAIPLSESGWTKLIEGKLSESDLDDETLCDISRDSEIGIHIYHIEKLDKSIKHFHEICLMDLARVMGMLKFNNKSLKVIGFSGLCTTKEGVGLFQNELKCRERAFISQEHILEKGGRKIIANASDVPQKLAEGYSLITRCQMLVAYPSEEGMLWDYF